MSAVSSHMWRAGSAEAPGKAWGPLQAVAFKRMQSSAFTAACLHVCHWVNLQTLGRSGAAFGAILIQLIIDRIMLTKWSKNSLMELNTASANLYLHVQFAGSGLCSVTTVVPHQHQRCKGECISAREARRSWDVAAFLLCCQYRVDFEELDYVTQHNVLDGSEFPSAPKNSPCASFSASGSIVPFPFQPVRPHPRIGQLAKPSRCVS